MVRLSEDIVVRSVSGSLKKRQDESTQRFLKRLTHLHLEEKGLSEMDGGVLSGCAQLTVLYLFDNRLSAVPDLSQNVNLTHVYLQNNLIASMAGICSLTTLVKLYLGGNQIATVEGLTSLKHLQELHVENQRLPSGEALTFDPRSVESVAPNLLVLNVAGNSLENLTVLSKLFNLRDLNASNNSLSDLQATLSVLRYLRQLGKLDLTGNPFCTSGKYRDQVILTVPRMEMFDNKEVTETCRRFIQNWQASKEAANERQAQREATAKQRQALREASVKDRGDIELELPAVAGQGPEIRRESELPRVGRDMASASDASSYGHLRSNGQIQLSSTSSGHPVTSLNPVHSSYSLPGKMVKSFPSRHAQP